MRALPVLKRPVAVHRFAGRFDGKHHLFAFLSVQELLRLLRSHLARGIGLGGLALALFIWLLLGLGGLLLVFLLLRLLGGLLLLLLLLLLGLLLLGWLLLLLGWVLLLLGLVLLLFRLVLLALLLWLFLLLILFQQADHSVEQRIVRVLSKASVDLIRGLLILPPNVELRAAMEVVLRSLRARTKRGEKQTNV